jgi:hypothetical protein
VPDQTELAQAQLVEVDFDEEGGGATPRSGGRTAKVQFNPETLKLTSANTVAKTDAAGSAAMQYIGSSSTKLDLELWFDATVLDESVELRSMTEGVYYFITPSKSGTEAKFRVPGVRFQWGAFTFDGVLTSLNETLELFSHAGQPLRSRISLSFASQEIRFRIEATGAGSGAGAGAGQTPRTPVGQGDSIQQLAGKAGGSTSAWKAVAAANGIENPRLPEVGVLLTPPRAGVSGSSLLGGST